MSATNYGNTMNDDIVSVVPVCSNPIIFLIGHAIGVKSK